MVGVCGGLGIVRSRSKKTRSRDQDNDDLDDMIVT